MIEVSARRVCGHCAPRTFHLPSACATGWGFATSHWLKARSSLLFAARASVSRIRNVCSTKSYLQRDFAVSSRSAWPWWRPGELS